MIVVHTDKGSLIIEEGSGRCSGPGCKRIGGGMAKFTVSSVDLPRDVEFLLCGNHVGLGLAAAIAGKPVVELLEERLQEMQKSGVES